MNRASAVAFFAGLAAFTGSISLAQRGESVKTLWDNNCASCHGDKGQGGGAGTLTLLSPALYGQERDRPFFDAIKNGVPDKGMAAFGETMSDAQVWGLVVHIRELQRDAARKGGNGAAAGWPVTVKPDANGVYATKRAKFKIEDVLDKGLEVPWSLEFLPATKGGQAAMLVTNRPGNLAYVKGGVSTTVSGTPNVRNSGQGGLMDVKLHPDYAKNGWVYLSFSDRDAAEGRSRGMTKVVRGKIALDKAGENPSWTEQQTIFEAKKEHYLGTDLHFGCKLEFDPKDSSILYFTIGERGMQDHAQDLGRPNGKVHRVKDDGTIPSDNPFAQDGSAYPSIWSYGHRNPQGLTFDLAGNLWDTEHGPRGGDEINPIIKGRNYGWPLVCFGINYSGSPFATPWPESVKRSVAPATSVNGKDDSAIMMPADRWLPSVGASGFDTVKAGPAGEAFPDWKGDLLGGGLAGQNVDRFRVKDGKVIEREEIFFRHGRVRDIVCGPEGAIYIVLNDPDKIVRLTPVGK